MQNIEENPINTNTNQAQALAPIAVGVRVEGTHGHERERRMRTQYADKRYKPENFKAGTNIRNRAGKRIAHTADGRHLRGIHEPEQRECTECGETKHRSKFEDRRVIKKDRKKGIRQTIICVDCNPYKDCEEFEDFVEYNDGSNRRDHDSDEDDEWFPNCSLRELHASDEDDE